MSTVCSYCKQSFISVSELSRHIRLTHANIKAARPGRQLCPVSASGLKTDASLDEMYSCSLCRLSFRSRDGLRCHEIPNIPATNCIIASIVINRF